MQPTFPYDAELLDASRALRAAEAAVFAKPTCKPTKLREHQARSWHDYLARQVREIAITRADASARSSDSPRRPRGSSDQSLLAAAD